MKNQRNLIMNEKCGVCFNDPCDCKDLFEPYNAMMKNEFQQKRYQITNLMFQIRHAETMFDFAQTLLEAAQKQFHDCISDYIVGSDDENRNDLIRFLYWKTDMKPKDIAELIDVAKERIYGIAGPLPMLVKCINCQCQFVTTIRSRNETPSNVCSTCDALKIRKDYDIWMNSWTPTPNDSPVHYASYITSHAWQKKAREMREKAGFKCQLCAAIDKPLNVHHNNYDRLGREIDSDLIVLCEPCHQKFHQSG